MQIPASCIKVFSLLTLLATLILPGTARAGMATEVILNKSVLLDLNKPSQRVSIATPSIAELVVISPTQLQIIGTRIGTTSLVVWDKSGATSFYDISVKSDIGLLESKIQEVAPNDSITVEFVGDTVVLAGQSANEQTINKVLQLARAFIEIGDNGSAKEERGSQQGSLKVLNHIEVDDPQQVLLEVKVAQVDKAALRSLGISILALGNSGEGFVNLVGAPDISRTIGTPPGIAGNAPRVGVLGPLANYQLGGSLFSAGIGGVLKALATKNLARMLAEPNLLVKSGHEGKFLAGSKIPIQVVSGVGAISGTTIQFIDVGVKLNFRPVVQENGLIMLKIDPAEVSSISGTLAVNGYPIIDTREIRTEVELKDGESLVLAGLLQEETIKTMSKIPLLGDIPILGALFRSTQDDLREKELIFFITPKVTKPNAPGTAPALSTELPFTPEQEKELKWMPMGD